MITDTGMTASVIMGTGFDMNTLFSILQFAGGNFPTGAFSQSWGLETYVFSGKIKTEEEFSAFLKMYIRRVSGELEGPVFCAAYDLAEGERISELCELEEQFLAMRLTKETRDVTARMGKAFLRIVSEMTGDPVITAYYEAQKTVGISFPVAFALVSSRQKAGKDDALSAFIFSTVTGLVQSGLKLIPLGNVQAQRMLLALYGEIEEAAGKASKIPVEDAFAFCPGLDIAAMKHEILPTRLYMT